MLKRIPGNFYIIITIHKANVNNKFKFPGFLKDICWR